MNKKQFKLKPFATSNHCNDIEITGTFVRKNNNLILDYLLENNLYDVVIEPRKNPPQRKNELWQTTCFEFFLAIPNGKNYWEFNLSPSGDWNIYHFDDYRQGMTEETAFNELFFITKQNNNSFKIHLNLDLNPIIFPEQKLIMGISAVIKTQSNNIGYWALTHPKTEADFHCRDSFIASL